MQKKLILSLSLIMLFALLGCDKTKSFSPMQNDYYTIFHDVDKIYEKFAEDTTKPLIEIKNAINNKQELNIDKAVEGLNTSKESLNTALSKIKMKTDEGKEYIKLKLELADIVVNNTTNMLNELKSINDKTDSEFAKLVSKYAESSMEHILKVSEKTENIIKHFQEEVK